MAKPSSPRKSPPSTVATTPTISSGARSPISLTRENSSRRSGRAAPRRRTKRTGSSSSMADKPILILLDEMPPYFHYLDTQKVGNGTVADIATRAFANLLTAAGKKKNVCVVVSDLAAAYEHGARLINRALEDARSGARPPGAQHHAGRSRCQRDLRHPAQASLQVASRQGRDRRHCRSLRHASWKKRPSPRLPIAAPRRSPTRSPPPIHSIRASRTSSRCSRRTSSSSRPAA